MNKVSVFYVNSMGFMSQWSASVISKDEKSISLRFSKNKALKFNLKDLDSDFLLVTKTKIKDIGICISKSTTAFSFDEKIKEAVLKTTQGNVDLLWTKGAWHNN